MSKPTRSRRRAVDELLTFRQASERIGLDPSRLRRLAASSRLPGAFKVGPLWLISAGDLEAFTRIERRPGVRGSDRQPRRRRGASRTDG